MFNTVIGLVIGLLVSLVVALLVSGKKKAAVRLAAKVEKLKEEAAKSEQFMAENYRGKEFKVSEYVHGKIRDDFSFEYVVSYGNTYTDIDTALDRCQKMTDEEFEKLESIERVMKKLHEDSMHHESVQEKKEKKKAPATAVFETYPMIGETIYVYKPSIVKLEPVKADEKNKPEGMKYRVIVEIGYKNDMRMEITKVHAAPTNVFNKQERYTYNFADEGHKSSFDLMIRNNKDYEAEMYHLDIIEKRLNYYNDVVKQGRVLKAEDGSISILPPSAERFAEIMKEMAAKNPKNTKKEEVKKETPKKEEQKKQEEAPKETPVKEEPKSESIFDTLNEEDMVSSTEAV